MFSLLTMGREELLSLPYQHANYPLTRDEIIHVVTTFDQFFIFNYNHPDRTRQYQLSFVLSN